MIRRGISLLSLSAALIFMNQSAQAISEHTRDSLNKKVFHKLFERFLDRDDDSVSWECFARGMAHNLGRSSNEMHQELAELFKSLSTSSSPTWIGLKLRPYKDLLKDDGDETLLNQYSVLELKDIIQNRIELNGKINCKQMMRELLTQHDEL